MDYDQFWLDLNEANINGKAEWKIEYNFKEFTGAKNFSPQEFERIFERMKTDDQFFKQYYYANSVQKVDYECDSNCMDYHLCTIFQQHYTEFKQNEITSTSTMNTDSTSMVNPDSTSTMILDCNSALDPDSTSMMNPDLRI